MLVGMFVGVGIGLLVRVCPVVLFCVVRMCVRGMVRITWCVVWSTVVAGWCPDGARCGDVVLVVKRTGSSAGVSDVATPRKASSKAGRRADFVVH